MGATLIDGRQIAQQVRAEVAEGVSAFRERHGRAPGLCTILVGGDPASATYIRGKERACLEVGMRSFHRPLPDDASEHDVVDEVTRAATNPDIDGILVQLPLPRHIDGDRVIEAIPPDKDVDGFHPVSAGRLFNGEPGLRQCTPLGVMRMLEEHDIDVAGADAVVVGRSNIVGKPMALMLLAGDATVTIAHRATRDLASLTRRADVVVLAVGKPGLLTGDMVKPGAVVIDVGITRTPEGLRGDADFESVAAVAGHITPVPGGVGPMTIAMLLHNTLQAARARAQAASPLP